MLLSSEVLSGLKFHAGGAWASTLMASLGSLNFGVNVALLNPILPFMKQYLHLCKDDHTLDCEGIQTKESTLNTIVFVGAMIGAMSASSLLKGGRRNALFCMDILFIFSTMLAMHVSATTPYAFYLMVAARGISGLGVGMATVAIPVWISETAPLSMRGTLGCMHQLMITLGCVLPVTIALPLNQPSTVDPKAASARDQFIWRSILGFPLWPALIQAVLLFFVYKRETPVFSMNSLNEKKALSPLNTKRADLPAVEQSILLELERTYPATEAEQIFLHVKAQTLGVEATPEEFGAASASVELTQGSETSLLEPAEESTYSFFQQLARAPLRGPLMVALTLSAMQQLSCINVIVSKSNAILLNAGIPEDLLSAFSFAVLAMNVIFSIVALFLIERLGRKRLLLIGTVFQTLVLVPAVLGLLGIINNPSLTSKLCVISLASYVAGFAIAQGPVIWVHLGEMFTPQTKGSALSAASTANWLVCMVVVFLSAWWSTAFLFTFALGMGVAASLFIIVFMKETAGKDSSPYFA